MKRRTDRVGGGEDQVVEVWKPRAFGLQRALSEGWVGAGVGGGGACAERIPGCIPDGCLTAPQRCGSRRASSFQCVSGGLRLLEDSGMW